MKDFYRERILLIFYIYLVKNLLKTLTLIYYIEYFLRI